MSEENVRTTREAWDHWKRGEIDALMEMCDEDVVIRPAEGFPERVVFGKQAVRSFYEALVETMGHDAVIEDLIDAGGAVVVQARQHMTGERSGVKGDTEYTQVVTFRRGKVILIEHFWDHTEALEAVGLRD